MVNDYEALEDTVRNAFAGVVWSHKTQEKQADMLASRYRWMQTANLIASAITSAGIIAIIKQECLVLDILAAFFSFVSIFLTAYITTFDLQNLITAHKAVASKLIAVRDNYKALILEIKLEKTSVDELMVKFNELRRQTDEIYSSAPNTTRRALKMANVALKIDEDNTFSDEEIDRYLPRALRKGKTNGE